MNIIILGRENVGKSTLFNTLLGERKALMSDIAGTTRDNKYGTVHWRDASFTLIDTAGVNVSEQTVIGEEVKKRINEALDLADKVVFVVDGQTGIVAQDRDIAKIIRQRDLPYVLAVNKIDSPKKEGEVAQFMQLGLGKPQYVSARSGLGTGDLLDLIIEDLEEREDTTYDFNEVEDVLKICFIGQPNVGKSSLLNSILGENKVIVSEIANTTREPNDIPFRYKENNLVLVDTAGLRRKRQKKNLDALSMQKSIQAIKNSDVVLLVLDGSLQLSVQDQRLAGIAQEENKGIVVLVNKWDLIEDKDSNTITRFQEYIQAMLPFLKGVPFLFVSATENQRTDKILDVALMVWQEMHREIKPKELERFMKRSVKRQKPRAARGVKRPRIYEIKQTGVNPPWFTVRIGRKDTLHASYIRFLENQLRDQYGFIGAPIKMVTYKLRREEQKKESTRLSKELAAARREQRKKQQAR